MPRYAFQLRIRAGQEEEYDRRHKAVWPELLQELSDFGVTEYSIFRRGQQLFLYLHAPDWNDLMENLAKSETNLRWQQMMAPIFEPVPDLKPGEPFAMMTEVFYMPGKTTGQ